MEDEITRDLHNITLYTAGSIESSGTGLAFTDGTTRSTLFEGLEPFYPIVKEAEGRVLAIHDFTFLVPPQNSILDNDRLVSNIADFLTDSGQGPGQGSPVSRRPALIPKDSVPSSPVEVGQHFPPKHLQLLDGLPGRTQRPHYELGSAGVQIA